MQGGADTGVAVLGAVVVVKVATEDVGAGADVEVVDEAVHPEARRSPTTHANAVRAR
jgi:hypothetical protein